MATNETSPDAPPRIAIAGATGFVGSALRRSLAGRYRIRGLTRSPVRAAGPDVEWRRCDLFRLREVTEALRECDVALYLVHSMSPSSRLTQANFADLDLLMADTFRRAVEAAGVRHIVFLSGLVPAEEDLSKHLASRLEVEEALAAGPVPVTTLRAGLIVGPGGSSFRVMANLVRRLPAMILPRWTRSATQPISLDDVVRAFEIVLAEPGAFVGRFDIGGPDRMSYKEMMRRTAAVMGRRIVMVDVRAFSPRLSVAWVSLFGGEPRALVGPLVDSLRHDMLAGGNPLQERLSGELVSFESAVRRSLDASEEDRDRKEGGRRLDGAPGSEVRRRSRVRSVQRFPLPPGTTAGWVAREFLRRVPNFVRPFVRVRPRARGEFVFLLAPFGLPMLELSLDRRASRRERRVYRITGGALTHRVEPEGRMEFRAMPDGRSVLVAVHDYAPSLPWYLYDLTQARAHLMVMRAFGRYLRRVADRRRG
jgi:uncharacterized protein YbjT (DUF2867 family)